VAQQEYLFGLHTGVSNRVLLAVTTLHRINLIPLGNQLFGETAITTVQPAIRTARHALASAALACLGLLPALAVEQEMPLDYRLNEHVVMVPAGDDGDDGLQTTVFRPNGAGPFPLLVINHGKEAGAPSHQARDRFIVMATAFVKRGYAVLVPMRRGFAGSGGTYQDHGCDMRANGYTQAEDVRATLAWAREQAWIDADRVVVAGQSYGGLATLALGTESLPGVRALLNFAGGLRDDGNHCDWRAALVNAVADYGARNRVPSLWLYGVNDSLFSPELVGRMHAAYVAAGGKAKLVEFGAFKRDAHGMLASRDGEKIWWKDTERLLQQVGMPTREVVAVSGAPALPTSNFAALGDIAAVPYLSEPGRKAYREYLDKLTPRAFAVSPSGAWCWAEEGEDPDSRALATCSQRSKQPCQLYSVDDKVVWSAGAVGGGGADGGGAPAAR
jgi:dienelactone hydrolase